MSGAANGSGVNAVYDFWLGLLPQFFAQFGAPYAAIGAATNASNPMSLPFPADQVAKAASITQAALQSLAQAYAPMLQAAGAPGLLGQWTNALPFALPMQQAMAAKPADLAAMIAPMMTSMTAPMTTAMTTAMSGSAATTAFERTFGAVSDALGFGPMRKLQAAMQELMSAALEQNEARTRYAMLVQGAFAAGFDSLLVRLAGMAKSGERVESVLALLRLWAVATEEAVHQVLQSERGLDATASIARAGLAYRRKVQNVASIVADALDMATRRDLDEAFREIQELKRELRALRAAPVAASSRATARKGKATS